MSKVNETKAELKPLNAKDEVKNETKKPKTFKEKLQYIKDNITIEPVLACYVVPGALARLSTQNLNLDKACRVNKGYGDVVCDALIARQGNKYMTEEVAVQELIASMETWKNILLTAIPSFIILFLGAWSDRTKKRKICILTPILGELLMCLSNILNTYFFYEIPVQITMFMEAIFPALTGSWVSTYMGAFSYISDVTSEESRTFRLGILNLCMTAGGPVGIALSGILLNTVGYYGVFGISSILYIASLLYGWFYISDPKPPNPEKISEMKHSEGVCGFLKSFFDMNHVKETFSVILKKGPKQRRLKFFLIFTAIFFIYGPAYGEFTVRYLYTRYKFNWDALMYSFYSTFFTCIHALGALISISLFSRRLKWDDSVLTIISSVSKIAGGMTIGLARTSFQMYLGVIIETFNATSYTALRSISSKLVSSDELGKITSLFNLMEIVTSMVYSPIYSTIYKMTISIDAGIVFYMSTVLTLPAVAICIWFLVQHKREAREGEADNETKDNKEDPNVILSNLELSISLECQ